MPPLERQITDRDSFFRAAEEITDSDVQDVILRVAYELQLSDETPSSFKENIFEDLRNAWGRA